MSAPEEEIRWQRLDPKSVVAIGARLLTSLLPAAALMVLTGAGPLSPLAIAGVLLLAAVLVLVGGAVIWYYTSYRVTGERLEMRAGNISRSHRSIPLDRVRSVDLTARPVHRLLGLSVLKVGTGQQSGDNTELKLDALATGRAERLRDELLGREPAPVLAENALSEADGTTTSRPAPDGEVEIATLRPMWLLHGMLTASLLFVTWGALLSGAGSLADLLRTTGVSDPEVLDLLTTVGWVVIALVVSVFLLVGPLGALLISTEMWWGFRLAREHDDTLRVRRGLLTTRSVSLEQRRLRGVELAEPLLLRWAGGCRTNAVATGLQSGEQGRRSDNTALLPPAPRVEAERVRAAVLGRDSAFGSAQLIGHPAAALRRRLVRAVAVPGVLAVAAAVAHAVTPYVPWWSWIAPAAVVPFAVAFAADAYRNLGHALHGEHLIARRGTAVRRTVALQRSGIIGWRFRQSVLQRRSDLITVAAVTAAGSGAYEIIDASTAEGTGFAVEAVPDLLRPFLAE